MLGNVVVDDVRNAGNVEPARRDIRRDKHTVFARFEAGKRLDAFPLRAVGVHRGNRDIVGFEPFRNAVGIALRPRENDNAFVVRAFKQREQQIVFLVSGDRIQRVRNRVGGNRARAHVDFDGIAQRPIRNFPNRFVYRCRKKQGLAIFRAHADNRRNVFDKTHVEHAVHFVEHQHFDSGKIDKTLAPKINQASGRGDNHFRAVA